MKDYYKLFIELSLQQCKKSDYAEKGKLKKHNTATKKLMKLQDEMIQFDCSDILLSLMKHEDERVKINASALCFKMNIFKEQAIQTLNDVVATSDDSTLCFSAKMLLKNN